MRLTESELAAIVPLLFAAAVMIAGWVAGITGIAIVPAAVVGLAALATAVAFVASARHGRWQLSFAPGRLAAFLLCVAGVTIYILWLAWPSLFPITQGPDIVHHLSLIHFIQQRHALPNAALGAYLGEMATYTPGSHLLAAAVADALSVDAIYIVHPLQAAAVGLQAGLVFNTLVRLGFRANFGVPVALAGAFSLLLPHRYLLEPITVFGFYSQVMAQTFAVAMLWAMVAWDQQPSRTMLAFAGICATAVVLCWPVYLPAASLAVGMGIAICRLRDRRLGTAIVDLTIALAPAAITIAIFSARHAGSAGILRSGGAVLVPSVDAFGWPFLAISVVGIALAVRHARTTAAVLAFAVACAVQIAALAVAQSLLGATNLYLANKTVFLLVVPLVVMGGFALARIGGLISEAELKFRPAANGRIISPAARNFSSASQPYQAPALLVSMVLLLTFSGLPIHPIRSPITEPVLRAGVWAKAHVPAPCLDYFVGHWITGYWLHLDVLGNARASERMRQETFDHRTAVSRWILPGGPRFAIVENIQTVPRDARANMNVLFQEEHAAVVERADGDGACSDRTPPLDRVADTVR